MDFPNYCPKCGQALNEPHQWPLSCPGCSTTHYNSPKPVVALVLHAWPHGGRAVAPHPGIILIRRGQDPHKNEWAFPGGYLDHKEDWRLAAAREAKEELGVSLDHRYLTLWEGATVVTPTNFLVLFVGYSGDVILSQQLHQNPTKATNGEILEITVASTKNINLGVTSHQAFWKQLRL